MKLNSKQKTILIILIGIIVAVITIGSYRGTKAARYIVSPSDDIIDDYLGSSDESFENNDIFVHIEGAVAKPGVYKLEGEVRIYEAVEAAGGLTEEADTTKINMAVKLADEAFVYIPAKGEEALEGIVTSQLTSAPQEGKININTADGKTLERLKGIGEVLAARIIEYRDTYGPFKNIEDIKNVSGIGESKFNSIKDDITVK